jgi:hypothetical protein
MTECQLCKEQIDTEDVMTCSSCWELQKAVVYQLEKVADVDFLHFVLHTTVNRIMTVHRKLKQRSITTTK